MGLFQEATMTGLKLRMALVSPTKGGKTYTALSIASGLGGKIVVIDTEHGRSKLYSKIFRFGHANLTNHHPDMYARYIKTAEEEGADTIIIDSYSHAWIGNDGALELANQRTKASRSGNSFAAWGDVTPIHNKLIEVINGSRCHIIATMRQKVEYVVDTNQNGKREPRKIGLAPVQRDGVDYEFDIVGEMDHEHGMLVAQVRVPFQEFENQYIVKPTMQFGHRITEILDSIDAPIAEIVQTLDSGRIDAIHRLGGILKLTAEQWAAICTKRSVKSIELLSIPEADKLILALQEKIDAKNKPKPPTPEAEPPQPYQAAIISHEPSACLQVPDPVVSDKPVSNGSDQPAPDNPLADHLFDPNDKFGFEQQPGKNFIIVKPRITLFNGHDTFENDQGLCECRVCGDFEAGLDKPCIGKPTAPAEAAPMPAVAVGGNPDDSDRILDIDGVRPDLPTATKPKRTRRPPATSEDDGK